MFYFSGEPDFRLGSGEGISLSVFGFRISQRFRVDGDDFENASRVDADIFIRIKKRCIFKNIRMPVDAG